MKTVKNIAELKRLALSSGASVSVGGRRFNTDGERVVTEPRREVEKTAPAPMPMPAQEVTIDMTPLAMAHDRMARMLSDTLLSMPKPESAVREWLFTVERDKNGLLVSITATAKE